ncbi:hypothetical protein NDU88_002294 [Pleurodeles waltl]|uniref:Uncharacterized protein n=1 Tax=Pleurodeles waltl TaxID=8319 RepID=A0AAV7T346_PLEWA|nr:hypothetical protein NDU88_002294 [Pleurodeles waltl]
MLLGPCLKRRSRHGVRSPPFPGGDREPWESGASPRRGQRLEAPACRALRRAGPWVLNFTTAPARRCREHRDCWRGAAERNAVTGCPPGGGPSAGDQGERGVVGGA